MPETFTSVDVVVPAFNEEAVVEEFYRRLKKLPGSFNILFVDNASTDRTVEIIQSFGDARLIRHSRNEGYGASIRDGLRNGTGDACVIIDADCEYPPEVIPKLLAALERYPAVYGSRFLDAGPVRMPAFRRWGNRMITSSFNLLFGQRLTDLYTGCKALRRSAIDGLPMERTGFEHVLELGARLAKRGVAIGEVPLTYEPRQTGRSKMDHVSETIKFFYLLLKYRLSTN